MRKFLIIALAAVALLATACKTTEANYKAAYDAAMAGRSASTSDSLDENTQRQLGLDRKNLCRVVVTGTDSIAVTSLFVAMESREGAMPQYSLAVNAFSQIFNARALLNRLREAGFADAYIFKSRTPDYYVAAGGSDDIADIPAMRARLEKAGNPGARAGFPAVIRSAGYRPSK